MKHFAFLLLNTVALIKSHYWPLQSALDFVLRSRKPRRADGHGSGFSVVRPRQYTFRWPLIVSLSMLQCILLSSSRAFAVKEYYALSRSFRALGMGGAYYALSNDEYAMFYNPAGVSLLPIDYQVMLSLGLNFSGATWNAYNNNRNTTFSDVSKTVDALVPFQGTPLYANANVFPYYIQKNFAVGLLIADAKSDVAILGKEFDSGVDATLISDTGLLLTYGRSLLDPHLHVGLTSKGIFRAGGRRAFDMLDIAQGDSFATNPQDLGGAGIGIDFDIGAIYEMPELPIGLMHRASLTFNNLIGSSFGISRVGAGNPPGLVRTLSLGWYSVFEGISIIDNFHVLIDFAEIHLGGEGNDELGARGGNFFKHINLGVEVPIQEMFSVRTGLHQGYLTLGLGLNVKFAKLEFATYAEELSGGTGRLPSRRYALRLALGWGSPPPPPVTRQWEPQGVEKITPKKPQEKAPMPVPIPLEEEPKDAKPKPTDGESSQP